MTMYLAMLGQYAGASWCLRTATGGIATVEAIGVGHPPSRIQIELAARIVPVDVLARWVDALDLMVGLGHAFPDQIDLLKIATRARDFLRATVNSHPEKLL